MGQRRHAYSASLRAPQTNTPERFVPITDELSATLEAWVGKMGVGPGRRVFAHLTEAVIRYAHEERAAPAVGRKGD